MKRTTAAAGILIFTMSCAAYIAFRGVEAGGRKSEMRGGSEAAVTIMTGNHLSGEKSPYLLQHADNPVDWYPWSGEAFDKAKAEDKPIFLSIGYSTCHWCHVMEHDSFENEEVAEILNRSFISIKVDREERPDVDSIYMTVCQAMTGSGGWPLTIIMTPDKKPFFAGTFFPADDAYGRRGLKSMLPEIAKIWNEDRAKIQKAADSATQIVQRKKETKGGELDEEVFGTAFDLFSGSFDSSHGGFQDAPKFPTAHNLSFLLRYWKRTGSARALEMVEKTLDNIDRGGIHDHIGGGFHRYSVDREWLVPHFEKMLYDQALLARAFLEAYQATGKERYAAAARDIFGYVIRDMTHPDGGFYSAEDADSEGEEGKFYVWKMAELKSLLGAGDVKTFAEYYGVTKDGNFENGTNILNVAGGRDDIPRKSDESEADAARALAEMRKILFDAREKRVRPHLDDKILTSWNALMISSLAHGAAALGDRRYSEAAEKAADFILSNLHIKGGLLRRYRDGEAAIPAFLDDYAFFSLALIDLYEATLDPRRLEAARTIADEMLRLFWDDEGGGFNFLSVKNEKLIGELKQAYDGAEPSGNSIAALALLKLAEFTTDDTYEEKANEIFSAFSGQIAGYPAGFTQMLIALDFSLSPAMEVVVTGEAEDPALHDMFSAINAEFLPNKVVVFYPAGGDREQIESIVPFLKMKEMIDGMPTAYVCRDFTCKFPTTDVQMLRKLLNQP